MEAAVLLGIGVLAQRGVPMRRWSRVLGVPARVPADADERRAAADPRGLRGAQAEVALAVARASARLPRRPSCLAQAFAGQVMLRRRHAPGVVVLGLRDSAGDRPERSGGPSGSAWEAHAWLVASSGTVTGGPSVPGFTPVTVFEVPGGPRSSEVDLVPVG